jgi:branched-chain amino acid transport system substrate-binding protein
MRCVLALGLVVAITSACSTNFTAKTCSVDGDCGSNVCEFQTGTTTAVCVAPSSATLHIGMSAPVSGPEQELGTDIKLGVTLAFNAQNAAGGINGRQLELDFLDDEYQPNLAQTNALQLVDVQQTTLPPKCPTTTDTTVTGDPIISATALDRGPNGVLAFIGNVGTPTMVRAAPISVEANTIFFGAFTGATTILRDTSTGPCAQYIFNVRASYAQEATATLEYFLNVGVPDYEHLISFDQNDTFGQAGYSGLVAAYMAEKGSFTPPPADPNNPIVRFRYTRGDDTTVPPLLPMVESYLASLLMADNQMHTVGVMMTDTYGPGTEFITGIRQWQFASGTQQTQLQTATRLNLYFSNVSFVGPNSLASRLQSAGTLTTPSGPMPYTQNVSVSQVVPNYESDSSDTVAAYTKLINAAQATPTFTSLEGYVDGSIFIASLLAHSGPFTPDSMVTTLEGLGDLSSTLGGLGPTNGYSPANHNYLTSVWGTNIDADGTFSNLYFWSDGQAIQFYQ